MAKDCLPTAHPVEDYYVQYTRTQKARQQENEQPN